MTSGKHGDLLTKYPGPYGYPAAIEGVGSTAAPLLAGFSFALVGFILDKGKLIWQPDLSLLLLVAAGLLLVQSVQLTFAARRYYVSPADYLPAHELAGEAELQGQLGNWQRDWLDKYHRLLPWVTATYNLGTIVFLLAIASVLVPDGGPGELSALRALAAFLAVAGAVAEAAVWLGEPIGRQEQIAKR